MPGHLISVRMETISAPETDYLVCMQSAVHQMSSCEDEQDGQVLVHANGSVPIHNALHKLHAIGAEDRKACIASASAEFQGVEGESIQTDASVVHNPSVSGSAQQSTGDQGGSIGQDTRGQPELLELIDACSEHESLTELIAADAKRFSYGSDEVLCSLCKTMACLPVL